MVKLTKHSSNSAPETYKEINSEMGQCKGESRPGTMTKYILYTGTYNNPTRNAKCTESSTTAMPACLPSFLHDTHSKTKARTRRCLSWGYLKDGLQSIVTRLEAQFTVAPAAIGLQLGSIPIPTSSIWSWQWQVKWRTGASPTKLINCPWLMDNCYVIPAQQHTY